MAANVVGSINIEANIIKDEFLKDLKALQVHSEEASAKIESVFKGLSDAVSGSFKHLEEQIGHAFDSLAAQITEISASVNNETSDAIGHQAELLDVQMGHLKESVASWHEWGADIAVAANKAVDELLLLMDERLPGLYSAGLDAGKAVTEGIYASMHETSKENAEKAAYSAKEAATGLLEIYEKHYANVLAAQGLHHDALNRAEDRRYEDAVRNMQKQKQSSENILRDSKRRVEDALNSSVSGWASAGAAANRAFLDGLNLAGIEAAVNRAMGLINQANQTGRGTNNSAGGSVPFSMSDLPLNYDMSVPVLGFSDAVSIETASAQVSNTSSIAMPVSMPRGKNITTNNNHSYPMEFHLHYSGDGNHQDAADIGRMFSDELSRQMRYRGFPAS